MNKEFIPYEQALALKELGFDESCMYAWCITLEHRIKYDGKMSLKTDGNPFGQFYKGKSFNGKYSPNKNKIQCSAPTFSQAFRFFREKYNINGHYWDCSTSSGPWCFTITNLQNNLTGGSLIVERCKFKTPEEAEIECLKTLIEIIKANNKNEEQK